MSDTDLQLLARYTRHRAEDAFAELVRRHIDLVHSAAMRQVRSRQLAEEVAQSVFLDLARQAGRLAPDTLLTAWLYAVTRRTAIDVVRREARRQLRESRCSGATEMNAMNATAADDWTHIEPLLDEAMHTLDETDRAAVLLRYFENKSLREVGAALGTSDDAAQKRVSRAVERLREFLTKRGVTVGASGLALAVSANAVQAAPVGLAVTILTAAKLTETAVTTTAILTKAIAMTTTQKNMIASVALLLCGVATVVVIKGTTSRLSINHSSAINLDNYVGRFEMVGRRLDLQKRDKGISVFIDGQPAFVAYPISEEKFVSHDQNSITEMTFVRDGTGRGVEFTLVRDGRKLGELKRTDDAGNSPELPVK